MIRAEVIPEASSWHVLYRDIPFSNQSVQVGIQIGKRQSRAPCKFALAAFAVDLDFFKNIQFCNVLFVHCGENQVFISYVIKLSYIIATFTTCSVVLN